MNYQNTSETDIAYQYLLKKGEPVYYKDLVLHVIEKKAKPVQSLPHAISEVYTLINMDSRFHYNGKTEGKSMWGLTEWAPPETKRSHNTEAAAPAGPSKSKRRQEKLLESIQEDS
ncbi:MAG: DNA-directed RNA polymerase subunit delta [Schwartzia sp.]|nr:DNA-directed RNA polymerase subunit delta [Schwartzia sp. (in: firmicutes)]